MIPFLALMNKITATLICQIELAWIIWWFTLPFLALELFPSTTVIVLITHGCNINITRIQRVTLLSSDGREMRFTDFVLRCLSLELFKAVLLLVKDVLSFITLMLSYIKSTVLDLQRVHRTISRGIVIYNLISALLSGHSHRLLCNWLKMTRFFEINILAS